MRVNCIDVLKAWAIISVVLFHSGFLLYGYLGVDLFLVISGYFTTLSLSRRFLEKNYDRVSTRSFFSQYVDFQFSKIIRLLPLILIAGTVCVVIGFFSMIDDTYESLSQSVIASSFFCNNIVELIANSDYWSSLKAYSPLMHTWYVGLLMQFFLLYPFLFYFVMFCKNDIYRTLKLVIIVFAFISLVVYLSEMDQGKRFYLLPARFYEFAVGGVIALTHKPKRIGGIEKCFVIFCYTLLVALLLINRALFPANVKLLLVVTLSGVLLYYQNYLENPISGNRIIAFIGLSSYSIYITHQIVLAFYRNYWGSHFSFHSYCLVILTIATVSWLAYILVERYTEQTKKQPRKKKFFLLAYGTLFFALNSFSFLVYLNGGVVRDIPELEVRMDHPQRGMCPFRI